MSVAGIIKSGFLLTSIVSEHTVMHSSYINRKGVENVATHDKYTICYSTLKESQSPSELYK